jgi:leucyl-tRNA synthetase
VNYKLRDWLFSRQRYWGEPFPILHEVDEKGNPTGVIRPLTEQDLPLRLPELEDFKPTGSPEGPLSKATDWVHVSRDGKRYRRETNTMPQWAGSCWYYLRYLDPKNPDAFCERSKADYWLPVDLYVGGAEHAVLHLLYSRFWHKVLFDRGHVPTPEPFQRLVNQGMILGENNEKMSKSRGNVINPDDVVSDYGADSLRLYEMFMGPLEAMKPWNMRSVEGVSRFLSRVWRLIVDEAAETPARNENVRDVEPDKETLKLLHKTIKKVTEDTEHLRFNTAIAAMMEFSNHLTSKVEVRPVKVLEPFVLLLAPYAPHVAEELWQVLGHTGTLAYEPWPPYDPELVRDDEIEIGVQINGKVKARIMVPTDADAATLEKLALADAKVQEQLAGKTVRKVIAKPRQMVSIVVG